MSYYTMNDDGTVAPCDVKKWGGMFEEVDSRRIASVRVNGCRVSTVFLGLDHGFRGGAPILFETMIFTKRRQSFGKLDQIMWRYESKAQAEAGHALVVRAIRHKRFNLLND